MWELDCKESWAPKNWCFWTVVLEKTLESPLDCKQIQPVNPKRNQPWIFIGRTDAEAETPILWSPDVKNWLIWKDLDAGKDWRWEEKGMTEDEMVGWHHWLNGHEFEWTLQMVMDRDAWHVAVHGVTKSQTWLSDWPDLSQSYVFFSSHVWMWELDCKETWALKNWCFWTVVLEKTLETPLDSRRSNQSILKEINPEYSLEGLEISILWSPDGKNWLIWKDTDIGKDWRWEEKGMTEDEMVGWHHWLVDMSLSKFQELG